MGQFSLHKGFHPHSFGETNYAYIKEKNFKASDIKEKCLLLKIKHKNLASSGTYYFKNAVDMLLAFNFIVKNNMSTQGEYYVSFSLQILLQ